MNPLSGVFSEAWQMYVRFARHLLALAFAVFLVAAILEAVFSGLLGFVGFLLALVVGFVATFLLEASLVKAVQDVRDGRADLSLTQTVRAAVPSFGPVAIASLIAAIGIAIGFLLLIIPGLYLLTIWYFFVPIIVIEGSGGLAALEHSRQLVRGFGWHVFGTVVLLIILQEIVEYLLGFALHPLSAIVGTLIATVVSGTIMAPFIALIVTMGYYRLQQAHGSL